MLKILLGLLLLNFFSQVKSDGCQVGIVASECVEGVTDLLMCNALEGVIINTTCAEAGKRVGRCCSNGYCSKMTSLLCLFMADGKWTDGDECPCPVPEVNSCCINDFCSQDYDEESCQSPAVNGVFFPNTPCAKDHCRVQSKLNGACCEWGETCFDMPKPYCKFDFYNGTTCEELGCAPPALYGNIPNTTSEGRCCTTGCSEEPYSACLQFHIETSDPIVYEYGQGCYFGYDCQALGVCTRAGICVENFNLNVCNIIGGSWIEGGECDFAPSTGNCELSEDHCVTREVKETCEYVGGTFSNETECPQYQGACCGYNNFCTEGSSTGCPIFAQFFKDETCTYPNPCDTINGCCFYGLCNSNISARFCESISSAANDDRIHPLNDVCQVNGLCEGDSLDLQDVNIDTEEDFSVTGVTITNTGSSITANSFDLSGSILKLSNSTMNLNSVKFSGSSLSLSLKPGQITVSGCLDVDNSELTIDLTEEEFDSLAEGEDNGVELMSYQCSEGTFDLTLRVNGIENDCLSVDQGFTRILLFNSCESSSPASDSIALTTTAISLLSIMF